MSLLQKVKSGMGSPDWNVSMVDIHLRKLLWVYCPGHAGVKGNDRADRLAGKATITNGLFLGRSEVLLSLRHYLRAQSQGHYTIDRLEERGVERGSQRGNLKKICLMESGDDQSKFKALQDAIRAIVCSSAAAYGSEPSTIF